MRRLTFRCPYCVILSEVTLNVCLGEEFEGGQLLFQGLRGERDEGQLSCSYTPRPGWAVMHVGG
jgi:hypothetical protein